MLAFFYYYEFRRSWEPFAQDCVLLLSSWVVVNSHFSAIKAGKEILTAFLYISDFLNWVSCCPYLRIPPVELPHFSPFCFANLSLECLLLRRLFVVIHYQLKGIIIFLGQDIEQEVFLADCLQESSVLAPDDASYWSLVVEALSFLLLGLAYFFAIFIVICVEDDYFAVGEAKSQLVSIMIERDSRAVVVRKLPKKDLLLQDEVIQLKSLPYLEI